MKWDVVRSGAGAAEQQPRIHVFHDGKNHWRGVKPLAAKDAILSVPALAARLRAAARSLAQQLEDDDDEEVRTAMRGIIRRDGRLAHIIERHMGAWLRQPRGGVSAAADGERGGCREVLEVDDVDGMHGDGDAQAGEKEEDAEGMGEEGKTGEPRLDDELDARSGELVRGTRCERPHHTTGRDTCPHRCYNSSMLQDTPSMPMKRRKAEDAELEPRSPVTSPVTTAGFKKPTGLVSWEKVQDNAATLRLRFGRDAIDTSPAAKEEYKRMGTVQCVLVGRHCTPKGIAAKTFSITQHFDSKHKDTAGIRAQKTLPQLEERQVEMRSTVTAIEAKAELGMLAAMQLFSLGASAHFIDAVRTSVLPLLLSARTLPSDSALLAPQRGLDEQATMLRARLRAVLRGIPVSLFVDGSDTKYSRRKKIIHVMADSAAIDHPVLLLVRLEDEASCDAPYFTRLLADVITEYELDRNNIVGVATDNTYVMPKSVRDAKLTHLPCAAHVIDLMLEGMASELGYRTLLGWRDFVGRSSARRAEMTKRGLSVACCQGACC